MMRAMTKQEVDESRRHKIEWVKNALDTEYGVYVGNILNDLEHLIDAIERDKK